MTEQQSQEGSYNIDLRFHKILETVEQELQTALAKARVESDHGTTIGDGAEEAVRKTLRSYLPSGYSVGKGIVYDAFGDGSRQTDVVITTPDHPLSFPEGKSGTYVVDGVAAAGEVKSCLDGTALTDSIAKGAAFKRLRMTINESDRVMTSKEQAYMQQIGLVPPYFVVAFDNKVTINTIGDRLREADLIPPPVGKPTGEQDAANTPQPPLDAICVLGKGVWLYLRPDNPMGFRIGITKEDGSKTVRNDYSGWTYLETDAPLVITMIWLHAAMPRVFRGRSVFSPYLVPPIRHAKYMNDRNREPDVAQQAPQGAGIDVPKADTPQSDLRAFSVDRIASDRRKADLESYLSDNVWNPHDGFVCKSAVSCRSSAEKGGASFYEGQGHMVGPCYDMRVDGTPLRVVVLPMETGEPKQHRTVEQRTEDVLNSGKLTFNQRNQHMKGVTFALRLAFGLPVDADTEHIQFVDGSSAHLFEAYAMTNLLLCSAVDHGTLSRGLPASCVLRAHGICAQLSKFSNQLL
ncbi:hypothetical protein HMPREF0591_5963 [Mycobacterium parascrofulaceum ATCC BAA-614]|uniref:DUF6602 domain-containing protein n=1 Tax=Mycobacterium parascrofulaceum ATCC BAA-614 TaxID=525368 RepID=D5PIG9_9MYCO|nr:MULTISPECIES: DUF6602 domain-containing protein [Mycobacterium]EFG74078.1 hypothetical protein HMPREF0591_5963 [Mycobacterium parascrofulaceum ATCC BAA-614]OCB37307.1 hypothetical protein A9X02_20055 [Mycobacterium malmoense]